MFQSKGQLSSLISKYKDKVNSFNYLFDKMYNETSLPLSIFFIKPEYVKITNCTKITELKNFLKTLYKLI